MQSRAVILLAIALLALPEGMANAILEKSLPGIAQMDFMELCSHFEQACAEYEVITADGYILTVHRIKGDETRPVLLWHGILGSSDDFLIRGLNSTSVSLAKAGNDIWLGNSRGNKYSRKHLDLDPDEDKKKYWNFSFHEMAVYDMAAVIDYILYRSGQKTLSAIGYSQGTTMFYVLASIKPVYNKKVRPFISMAPIASLTHIKPLFRDLIPLWPTLNTIFKLNGVYEVFQDKSAVNKIIQLVCSLGDVGTTACKGLAMLLAGNDRGEIELDFFKVIVGHFPAGTSTKDIDHYVQVYGRNRFARYDYGLAGNLKNYGAVIPPDYDMSKVTTPVALLCGAEDHVSTLKDVAWLKQRLPNVIDYKVMEFNHIDFVWGRNIDESLNPKLKKLLQKFS